MKETAAGTEEGDAALYEFLDGLIAKPETAIEGATMTAEMKKAKKNTRQHAGKSAYSPL
ncbi:MAG: hypothetical protein LBR93_11825 [Treponema sp.]|jgi:hypothetical protein|nr:hypothetical protein [Treponema sp.]